MIDKLIQVRSEK